MLVLLVFIFGTARVGASSNIVFVDRIFLSKYAENIMLNTKLAKHAVGTFTNTDKIIFYYASVGVINPTKKSYDVEIICKDKNGSAVFKETFKKDLSEFSGRSIGKEIIKTGLITFTLDPKPGAMLKGQLIPLESHHDYFVTLYFEHQILGSTEFNYLIVK